MCNRNKKTTYSDKENKVIYMYSYLQEINSKYQKCKKIAKKFKKCLTNVIFRDIIDKHSNERAQKQRVLKKA